MFPKQVQSNQRKGFKVIRNFPQERQNLYPLHDAAKNGNIEKVIMLLGSVSDVGGLDDLRHFYLYYAVNQGLTDICKLLCEHNANVNEQDKVNKTLLHWAAYKGHLATVKLLLGHAASVHAKDNSGKSPIYWAMLGGHIEIIKIVLEYGAKLDETDEDGATPLHYVSKVANKNISELFIAKNPSKTAIAQLLIDKGANKTAEDKRGFTPFMLAIEDKDLYEILLPDGCLKKPEDPTWKCSICLESITDLDKERFPYITLDSRHTFHLSCITKNVSTQVCNRQLRNCPICRTDISKSIFYLLLTRCIPKDHPLSKRG